MSLQVKNPAAAAALFWLLSGGEQAASVRIPVAPARKRQFLLRIMLIILTRQFRGKGPEVATAVYGGP